MYLVPKPDFRKLGESLVTQKDMLELAITLTTDIRNRTAVHGVDYHNQAFRKYTPNYAKRKGSSKVDLLGKTTGPRMLNNMKQKATKKDAVIYFADSGKNDLAVWNSDTREFFEISSPNETKILKEYEKKLDAHIKRWERT